MLTPLVVLCYHWRRIRIVLNRSMLNKTFLENKMVNFITKCFRSFFYSAVNLQKPEIVVNSSGSNNEIVDLTLKHPDAGGGGGGSGRRRSGSCHEKTDDEVDIIGQLIGGYGKWQFVMTFLLALFQVPNTFHIYSPTFQVSEHFTTFFFLL